MKFKIVFVLSIVIFWGCQPKVKPLEEPQELTKGTLFIIGGGHKSDDLILKMVELANIKPDEYAIILPMASEMPDTAIFNDKRMLSNAGVKKIHAIKPDSLNTYSDAHINLLKGAKLIYLSGGDQNNFMKAIEGTNLKEIIYESYKNGATIAGTSAGAAVMSQKMVTGNQLKHPDYTGEFKSIEANNIEISEGLGLLKSAIIDQHFIKRQRMNRLITVCLENPEEMAIGIDESTALIVINNKATVYGENQVVTIKHTTAETKVVNGLLGAKNLELNIFLPGDSFLIIE